METSERWVLRRVMAVKGVKNLATVDCCSRVSGMQAKIIEVRVKTKIITANPP